MSEDKARATCRFTRAATGQRLGLMAECLERRAGTDPFPLYDSVALGGRLWGGRKAPTQVFGGGAASRRSARAAAIGEAMERMSLAHYDERDFFSATVADLADPLCRAADLRFFLDEQHRRIGFPLARPDLDRPLRWVRGWALVAARPAAIPASLVYLPYRAVRAEPILANPLSVGTSCARSHSDAALLAVLELAERDAWTMAWEARVPVAEIAAETVGAVAATARAQGLSVRAFDLTNDVGLPAAVAVVESRGNGPALAIGTAARPTMAAALKRAVAEAITSWRSTAFLERSVRTDDGTHAAGPAESESPFAQVSRYYAEFRHRDHFAFLLDRPCPPGTPPPRPPGVVNGLAELRTLLARNGHEVVLFDLTQPDVAALGLAVVRAVSLTMLRQTVGDLRCLANPRLLAVPKAARLIDPTVDLGAILSDPHPFP